jgi:small subunit ribosomal protein S1
VLRIGDEVDVYVLSVDQERRRIALSLKKLQPDPWTMVDDHYQIGQLVEGRVTRVVDFGAFVAVDLGIEGLLHAKEMIGTPELAPADIVQAGDKLPVKIIGIDSRRRRLDLSAKQVRQDEWEHWMAEQQAAQETGEAATELAVEEAAESAEAESAEAEPTEAEFAGAEAVAPGEADESVVEEAASVEAEVPAPEAAAEAIVEEASSADVEKIVAEAATIAGELPGEEGLVTEAATPEAVVEQAASVDIGKVVAETIITTDQLPGEEVAPTDVEGAGSEGSEEPIDEMAEAETVEGEI